MGKKIFIIGSSGFIGKKLVHFLEKNNEIIPISRHGENHKHILNLADTKPNDSFLEANQIVIFLAATSSIEQCEKEYNNSYKINVENTAYIISKALKLNNKVLFFSSDAVFGDDKEVVFNDDGDRNPISNYGKMKKEIEECFKNEPKFKAIRLPYIFSKNDKFTKYYFDCLYKSKVVEVYHPFYRNVITMNMLLQAIYNLLRDWEKIPNNLINFAGNHLISRINIIDALNCALNENVQYIITTNQDFWKNRPMIVQMKSKVFAQLVNLDLDFFTMVKKELNNIG